ncbi:hypothetical protein D3C73_1083220 [compost metagenome]
MRKQRVVLEDEADIALVWWLVGNVVAVDGDLAFGDIQKAGDHAQRRGLAAAGRAEQAEQLALRHVDVEIVDGHVVDAVALGYALELEKGLIAGIGFSGRGFLAQFLSLHVVTVCGCEVVDGDGTKNPVTMAWVLDHA